MVRACPKKPENLFSLHPGNTRKINKDGWQWGTLTRITKKQKWKKYNCFNWTCHAWLSFVKELLCSEWQYKVPVFNFEICLLAPLSCLGAFRSFTDMNIAWFDTYMVAVLRSFTILLWIAFSLFYKFRHFGVLLWKQCIQTKNEKEKRWARQRKRRRKLTKSTDRLIVH